MRSRASSFPAAARRLRWSVCLAAAAALPLGAYKSGRVENGEDPKCFFQAQGPEMPTTCRHRLGETLKTTEPLDLRYFRGRGFSQYDAPSGNVAALECWRRPPDGRSTRHPRRRRDASLWTAPHQRRPQVRRRRLPLGDLRSVGIGRPDVRRVRRSTGLRVQHAVVAGALRLEGSVAGRPLRGPRDQLAESRRQRAERAASLQRLHGAAAAGFIIHRY